MLRRLLTALALALAGPAIASAAAQADAPPTLSAAVPSGDVGLSRAESRLADRVVPDIQLQLADGRTLRVSELAADQPLLVTFFYRRCTGVCTPLLEWVRDSAAEVGGLGADYRVLALSFDDADTVADLQAQAQAIGVAGSPHWSFAVAEREAVARVAGALDFWYRRDPQSGQYDHPALVLGLADGRVVRALLGGPGDERRMRELLWELRGVFIPSYRVPGQTALSCTSFDPRTGQTRLDWGLALLALPGVAAIGAALTVFGRSRSALPVG